MSSSGIGDRVGALVFDVFGTVVDWRSSVIRDGEKLSRETGLNVDWTSFAEEWRRVGYHEQIAKIRSGAAPQARRADPEVRDHRPQRSAGRLAP
jgi:2-haloacid dehalogenase